MNLEPPPFSPKVEVLTHPRHSAALLVIFQLPGSRKCVQMPSSHSPAARLCLTLPALLLSPFPLQSRSLLTLTSSASLSILNPFLPQGFCTCIFYWEQHLFFLPFPLLALFLWVWHKLPRFRKACCVSEGLQRTQQVRYTSVYFYVMYLPMRWTLCSTGLGDIRQGKDIMNF